MGQAVSFPGAAGPEGRTSLASLPPEVLLKIVKQCDAADVASLSRTCRYMAVVCDDLGALMHIFFDSVCARKIHVNTLFFLFFSG